RWSKTSLAPSIPTRSTQEANTGLRSSCSSRLRPVTDPLGRTSAVTWVPSVVSSRDRSTAWPRNPVTPVRRIRVLPPAVVDAAAEDGLCDMDSLYGRGYDGGGGTRGFRRWRPASARANATLIRAALVYRSRHAQGPDHRWHRRHRGRVRQSFRWSWRRPRPGRPQC